MVFYDYNFVVQSSFCIYTAKGFKYDLVGLVLLEAFRVVLNMCGLEGTV